MMITRYFCTLFDSNYLIKGLAMIRSLRLHSPSCHIFILCMDDKVEDILIGLELSGITCIALADFEDDALLAVKPIRSVAEYCWTLSPCLPWYVLEKFSKVQLITYIDADLFFYSSIEPLYDEIGEASIAIIEHRFSTRLKHLEINGRFCVEWVSFRRDEQGLACLARWRDQCIDWCHNRLEDGKMGDQKYLDEWPERYKSLHIIAHEGAGLAPWNYSQYRISTSKNNMIFVNNVPLIFYHFHQFQLLNNGGFDRISTFYTDSHPESVSVYDIYEVFLKKVLQEIRTIEIDFSDGMRSAIYVKLRRLVHIYAPQYVKELLRNTTMKLVNYFFKHKN